MKLYDEVKEYFVTCFDESMEDLFKEYNDQTLVFSFLMGMPPEECRGMEVEPEFTDADVRQFEEVEDAVSRLRRDALK